MIDLFRKRPPQGKGDHPVPFLAGHARLHRIAAIRADGRCLIARGYESDPELRRAISQLKAKGRVPKRLQETTGTLEDVDRAWRFARPATAGNEDLKRRIAAVFRDAAQARASDVIFEHDGVECRLSAIVNDAKLALGHPIPGEEGRQLMGYLFHAKDEGSAQTSYQRGEFQGFSIRSGGEVPLPPSVSGLRCQRGPHDPGGDHMFCRLFYRDQLEAGMTLEKLGFEAAEAAVFAEVRMSLSGGIFLGGSTGDGKSTTLAVNLALQQAEHGGELNLVTLEDPVEYRIDGAVQIAVPTSGSGDERSMHFRRALMHFCRVHPASGMVSEIRDHDAASQVLQFVDTGHQVWTTIHVDSANAILFRLLDMGVEPSTLTKPGNVALLMKQTLLPMLCQGCALHEPPAGSLPDWLARHLERLGTRPRWRNRAGCAACRRADANAIARQAWTGYTRQQVVAEMIRPDADWLVHVARRDPIAAWRHWTGEMGGVPIARRIWRSVARGLVDPLDALAKGARTDEIPEADAMHDSPGLRLIREAGP